MKTIVDVSTTSVKFAIFGNILATESDKTEKQADGSLQHSFVTERLRMQKSCRSKLATNCASKTSSDPGEIKLLQTIHGVFSPFLP